MKEEKEEKMPFKEGGIGEITIILKLNLREEAPDLAVEIVEQIKKALIEIEVPWNNLCYLAELVRDYMERIFRRSL